MNKMKMFKRFTITMMAIILMVGVGIFMSKPIDAYASQIQTGETTETLSITFIDRANISQTLTFDIRCTYTAVWDEGYDGHIESAIFFDATNEYMGDMPVNVEKVLDYASADCGDSKYMLYSWEGIQIEVRISVDEWGEVDLWIAGVS